MTNSNQKGKTGERDFAKRLTQLGFTARRGQQFAGGKDSPDVMCEELSGLHFEVKFYKTCKMFSPAQIEDWEVQAVRDAGNKRPLIAHRWNGQTTWWIRDIKTKTWMTLEDFLDALRTTQG